MTSTVQSLGQEITRPTKNEQAAGATRLDWAMVLLTGWWVGGAYLDGWAHQHGRVDQSFFTSWHAVLYSGFLAVAGLLLLTLLRNGRRGYRPWLALPAGYELSLVGVAVFGLAGAGDLVWHTLFGIEADVEALLSPTHLLLAVGAVLAMSGPLRALWRRPTATGGLIALLPMLLSLTFVLSIATFMTQFAHPLVNAWAAQQPGSTETISQLYVMNADGTGQTRLLNDPQTQYWHAAYSPDGRQIAYAAGPEQNLQIFVADADGSHPRQLTNDPGSDISPAWSPDGRQIAFTSGGDVNFQIYVMNADGSGRTRLTDDGSNLYPAWSPDGRTIAFTGIRGGEWQIYVIPPEGGGEARLTSGQGGNYFPQWSPDGRRILFTSVRDGMNQIYVMNADGSGQTRLTDNRADDRFGRWSPDGQKIAFASRGEGNFEIYVMNADGSGLTNLTQNPGLESGGLQSWSPDGSKIIFTAQSHPRLPSFLTEELGIASILLQAGLLTGLILLALRRWQLPPGSLTLIFTLNAILMSFLRDQFQLIPAALGAGLIGDLFLWRLKPSATRSSALRLVAFAMPAIFYGCYFLALRLTQGLAWTIALWMGSIVLAGIVGLLLSYLLLPPSAPAEQGA